MGPKQEGGLGLGFRSIGLRFKAVVGKLVWHLFNCKETIWINESMRGILRRRIGRVYSRN